MLNITPLLITLRSLVQKNYKKNIIHYRPKYYELSFPKSSSCFQLSDFDNIRNLFENFTIVINQYFFFSKQYFIYITSISCIKLLVIVKTVHRIIQTKTKWKTYININCQNIIYDQTNQNLNSSKGKNLITNIILIANICIKDHKTFIIMSIIYYILLEYKQHFLAECPLVVIRAEKPVYFSSFLAIHILAIILESSLWFTFD